MPQHTEKTTAQAPLHLIKVSAPARFCPYISTSIEVLQLQSRVLKSLVQSCQAYQLQVSSLNVVQFRCPSRQPCLHPICRQPVTKMLSLTFIAAKILLYPPRIWSFTLTTGIPSSKPLTAILLHIHAGTLPHCWTCVVWYAEHAGAWDAL